MRVPKFRAWLKEKQLMFDVCEMTFLYDEVHTVSDEHYNFYASDEFELMQFTGLKDKHGEEIFEGDIVRYECCSEGYVEEVIYDNRRCNFGTIDKDGETFSFDALISDFYVGCFEVIGNKYNDPELLKGE